MCSKLCKSILKSSRVFEEINVEIWKHKYSKVKLFKEVLLQHQLNLRKFTIICYNISERKLFKLLTLLPNLEEIVLDFNLKKMSTTPSGRLQNLSKLKSLHCRAQMAAIIFELPNDILQKLSFEFMFNDLAPTKELMKRILEKQKIIEELSFNPEGTSAISLPPLKKLKLLKSSIFTNLKNMFCISKILKNQNQLISLTIQNIITRDIFLLICNIRSLEKLDLELDDIDDGALQKLNSFQKLKELRLAIYKTELNFSSLKLPFLRKLRLYLVCDEIELNLVLEQFPLNFPNLKHLQIAINMQNMKAEHLPGLLQNKLLEKLDVCLEMESNFSIEMTTVYHDRLKEVCLGNDYFQNALNYIIKAAPKLEKLCTGISNLHVLKQILINCPNLSHLKVLPRCLISFESDSFIHLIQEHGKNLTYFECEASGERSTDETTFSKLQRAFEIQFSKIELCGSRVIMKNVRWDNDQYVVE